MSSDAFVNVALLILGVVFALASPLIRTIVRESILHPLKKTRLELGSDHRIVAS